MKISLIAALLILLPACAFYPKTQYSEEVKRCNLNFKKLTLDVTSSSIRCQGNSKSAGACVVLAGVISGGSAIVSGSIVLVGNSLHWLEKQGKCDDSFLNSKILHHNKPLLKDDGVLVTQEKSAQ